MDDAITITCVQCATQLQVPRTSIGKRARCSVCQATMPIAEPADAALDAQLVDEPNENPFGELQPTPFALKTESATQRVRRNQMADEGGVFSPEKKGIQSGVVGGIVMMLVAVVWFFGGLAAGIIFYYPPILFIVGVYALVKGLITGNVAGGRNRRY